jgi:hypothetical protein
VYGPVRTVVWQGSAGDRRPYADLTGHSEVKTSARLARSTEPEVGICEGKLTDSGWLKGPQKGSCDRFCIIADRRF